MSAPKQLTIDFDSNDIIEESIDEEVKVTYKKCNHSIKIKSFKSDYISYCSRCGKILSVKHKK